MKFSCLKKQRAIAYITSQKLLAQLRKTKQQLTKNIEMVHHFCTDLLPKVYTTLLNVFNIFCVQTEIFSVLAFS